MISGWAKRLLRIFRRIFLFVFLLLLLLILAVHLPFVQRWLGTKASSLLSDQLRTEVAIERVVIKLPTAIGLRELHILDQSADTLARLDRVQLGLNMFSLLGSRVVINSAELSGLRGNFVRTDSSSNFGFITEALTATPDTLETDTPTTPSGWTIELDDTRLRLDDIDLYYQDDPAGLLLDLELQAARLLTDSVSLQQQDFQLQEFTVDQLRLAFHQRTIAAPESAATATAIRVGLERLNLRQIEAEVRLDTMAIDLLVGVCTSAGLQLALDETLTAQLEGFDLRESKISYDQTTAPTVPGLDPNHLSLDQLNLQLADLEYRGDSLQLQVEELALRESSGLSVEQLQGKLLVHPAYLSVRNLSLNTTASRLELPELELDLNSITDLDRLQLNVRAQGQLAVSDILAAQPQLRSAVLLGRNPAAGFAFNLQSQAVAGELKVRQLVLRGPGVQIAGQGAADHLGSPDQLNGEFKLAEFSLRPRALMTILPAGTLPGYLNLPEEIRAQGRLSYYEQELKLNLGAREQRLSMERWSGFDARGQLSRPLAFPNSVVDLQLDSLQLTRQSIFAYLPPSLLPPGYQLPAYLWLEGSLNGPVADLLVDLSLEFPGDSTFARVQGRLLSVTEPEQLSLDLAVSQLQLKAEDILPLLPDSLLPEQFALPDLEIQEATLQGPLDDLEFQLPVATSFGQLSFSGRYNPANLSIRLEAEALRPAALFSGAIRDTLLGLKLQPIGVQAELNGRLQPGLQLEISADVQEQGWGQILNLNGKINGNAYQAELAFQHPSLRGSGEIALQLPNPDSLTEIEAHLSLEKIDLERWGLSDRPLLASGRLDGQLLGLQPDQLQAAILLDDVLLRSSGATAYVDSFALRADLDQGVNELQIRSDVMRADLEGEFEPLALIDELQRFLSGYWETNLVQPDPVVNGQRLVLDLEVFNPRPLISGIIPGLTDLSPLQARFRYRDPEPGLIFDLDLQRLAYRNLQLDKMEVRARGDVAELNVAANWGNIALSEQFQLGKTQLTAEAINDALAVELRVFAAADSLRHRLGILLAQDTNGIQLELDPAQLINFNRWELPEDNRLTIGETTVGVNNWRLSRGDRSLLLRATEENGLQLDFIRFNLQTISRIINSEEELLAGELNGTFYLDNLLTDPGIRADATVDQLAVLGSRLGDLRADVSSQQNDSWLLDVALNSNQNELRLNGAYAAGGELALDLEIDRFQLKNLEPFSLGYLQKTKGYLNGQLAVGGTLTAPQLAGELTFKEAALAVSLLGSRFRLQDQSLRFAEREVRFNNFTLLDSLGNEAVTDGKILIRSLEDIGLDLNVRARDFLAVNATAQENDLFYGYLQVDADVAISGTARAPSLEINASPKGDSRLTYAYVAPNGAGVNRGEGVVTFAESYEWEEILTQGNQDSVVVAASGMYLETNLDINDNLLLRVIVDPVTRQEFSGRGTGNISFIQYPNGRQELTGGIEMQSGTYDMVLEGIRPYEFRLRSGSSVDFTGNPQNPQLDLDIYSTVQTTAVPLVEAFNPTADLTTLSRRQTFEPVLSLNGDLNRMEIKADVLYPDNQYGNRGISAIEDALAALRKDQSRMYTTAITLITFGGFNIPLIESGQGGNNRLVNNVADAVSTELSSFLNNQLGFVDLELGVENYQTASGEENYNLSLSLSKSFLDDRLIISVDGVANTAEDATTGEAQTYLDNISAEYLLSPSGQLRIKLFNDRDRNVLVGGRVLRFGGRLVFSKDFNRFFWEAKAQ